MMMMMMMMIMMMVVVVQGFKTENLYKNKRPDGLTRSAASGNTHYDTPKYTPNKHVKQEGCETIGKYLRKWLKTWILFYFGSQNDPQIGPLRPIFKTPLREAQIEM